MARTCLYGYQQIQQVHCYEVLLFIFVHLTKGRSGMKRHAAITDLETILLYLGSAWCGRMLQSYISVNISPCNYLLVQLIYLNE